MQKKTTILLIGFFILIAALLVTILAILSKNTSNKDGKNKSSAPDGGLFSSDLSPERTATGKYKPVSFSEDEFNRVILIHFNLDKIEVPLLLCPIERYIELNPELELLIFTPNSTLIEENLVTKNHPNINYYDYQNLPELFKGLPIELLCTNKTYGDRGPRENLILTELIRLAAVYKYGGLYSDLDVIPRKLYDKDKMQFFVAENEASLASIYFRFPKHSPTIWMIMEHISDYHPPNEQGVFGKQPIGEVLSDYCEIYYDMSRKVWTQPARNLDEECGDMKVLPMDMIFPIRLTNISYFGMPYSEIPEEILKRMNESLGMHWWSSIFKNGGCLKENSLLATIAREMCPGIYQKHREAIVCDEH